MYILSGGIDRDKIISVTLPIMEERSADKYSKTRCARHRFPNKALSTTEEYVVYSTSVNILMSYRMYVVLKL